MIRFHAYNVLPGAPFIIWRRPRDGAAIGFGICVGRRSWAVQWASAA